MVASNDNDWTRKLIRDSYAEKLWVQQQIKALIPDHEVSLGHLDLLGNGYWQTKDGKYLTTDGIEYLAKVDLQTPKLPKKAPDSFNDKNIPNKKMSLPEKIYLSALSVCAAGIIAGVGFLGYAIFSHHIDKFTKKEPDPIVHEVEISFDPPYSAQDLTSDLADLTGLYSHVSESLEQRIQGKETQVCEFLQGDFDRSSYKPHVVLHVLDMLASDCSDQERQIIAENANDYLQKEFRFVPRRDQHLAYTLMDELFFQDDEFRPSPVAALLTDQTIQRMADIARSYAASSRPEAIHYEADAGDIMMRYNSFYQDAPDEFEPLQEEPIELPFGRTGNTMPRPREVNEEEEYKKLVRMWEARENYAENMLAKADQVRAYKTSQSN